MLWCIGNIERNGESSQACRVHVTSVTKKHSDGLRVHLSSVIGKLKGSAAFEEQYFIYETHSQCFAVFQIFNSQGTDWVMVTRAIFESCVAFKLKGLHGR